MRKKHSATLIEVLIALGLLTLLIGALFSIYSTFFIHKAEFLRAKEKINEKRYLFSRLKNIFKDIKTPFFSSDEGKSLVFIFDRGVYEKPLLSGGVLGKLYLNEKERKLYLSVWPKPESSNPKKEPCEHFILMENIDSLTFSFYAAPEKNSHFIDPDKIGHITPNRGWQSLWALEYEKLPALLQVKLSKKDIEETFIFDFNQPIFYLPEKIDS